MTLAISVKTGYTAASASAISPAVAPNSSNATNPTSATVIVPSTACESRTGWIAGPRLTSCPSIRSTRPRK